ncbi:hypothetical protein [Bdellovibrio sp. BCCA]|uniref:hypothetical protein n=1 Tax=Bdellovibrio sp. BCCA TaxID=3136281 RepID=UPI0030F2CF5A
MNSIPTMANGDDARKALKRLQERGNLNDSKGLLKQDAAIIEMRNQSFDDVANEIKDLSEQDWETFVKYNLL